MRLAVRLLADIREGKKPVKIIPADKQEELKLRTLSMGKWLNQSYGSDETVPKHEGPIISFAS